MKHGSLFSGIGGFDLAAEWMGWENVFHCEWEDFPRKILNHYWPNAQSYGDITKTDFTIHRGQIDILTGGFPCQPYSSAGKRLGKEDDRHLWPEMLRAIREIQPGWVVGENVRGLTNWNGGLVFDEVQADLEAEGYEVLPFLLPACGVNAPHRRDRIWFVAHRKDGNAYKQKSKSGGKYRNTGKGRKAMRRKPGDACVQKPTPDAKNNRPNPAKKINEREEYKQNNRESLRHSFISNGESRLTPNTGYAESQESKQHTKDNKGSGGKRVDEGNKPTPCAWNGDASNPNSGERFKGGMHEERRETAERYISPLNTRDGWRTWENFPTQSPIRSRYDGFSERMVRNWNIVKGYYATISEGYTREDLQKMREAIQSEEIWQSVRGLQQIYDKTVLQSFLWCCEKSKAEIIEGHQQVSTSTVFENALRKMRKHEKIANTPLGRKLEEQFPGELANIVSILPHEIALAALEVQEEYEAFCSKERKESIKAYGNAIVPQIALMIFKSISKYEELQGL